MEYVGVMVPVGANVGEGVSVNGAGRTVDVVVGVSIAWMVNAAAVCTSLGGRTCSADGRLQDVRVAIKTNIVRSCIDRCFMGMLVLFDLLVGSPANAEIKQLPFVVTDKFTERIL